MKQISTMLLLCLTFVVIFVMTTLIVESICLSVNYYQEGLEASASFNE